MTEKLRFTILEHQETGGTHWDLLLELPGTEKLATWSVPVSPEKNSDFFRQARKKPDHRRIYLDYEGPLSGDRGNVRRWDSGTYQFLARENDFWIIFLHGEQIFGQIRLDTFENGEFRV